jgi:hypothetical protein
MNALLTTITPVWKRPEMLRGWVRAIRGASIPEVKHFVYFVGENPPEWWTSEVQDAPIIAFRRDEPGGSNSIGFYHNIGAISASSEWIMKLDIDTIPNVKLFSGLMPVIKVAQPRQWFNCGMITIGKASSEVLLADDRLPLVPERYLHLLENRKIHACGGYKDPSATNFICRRNDYLNLGGCNDRFKGWGWEDYQQIYFLERYARGNDPLPGFVDHSNVTQRCRDEIARPKAMELWRKNKFLCLLHRFHGPSSDPEYKNSENTEHNRSVLFEIIKAVRTRPYEKNLASVG